MGSQKRRFVDQEGQTETKLRDLHLRKYVYSRHYFLSIEYPPVVYR